MFDIKQEKMVDMANRWPICPSGPAQICALLPRSLPLPPLSDSDQSLRHTVQICAAVTADRTAVIIVFMRRVFFHG